MKEKTIIICKFSHYTKSGNGVYFINVFKCKDNYLTEDVNYLKNHDIPYRATKKGQVVDIQAIKMIQNIDPYTHQFIRV